ncbi:hypothetical protein HUN41_00124 [Streptomyces phage Coruscant]|uniref:Uncharacterized protein n=1 Tax=Streptomyces phage Coruscant TaxID=2739834 RepID=A0A7G4AW53_9CAUD|nr:hypothetical protein PP454_gp174 [Streptomyces phage Coruscant]QMP84243.1 hypothetical protein HUN41_00124 [Streptomyces phage Coruscant]
MEDTRYTYALNDVNAWHQLSMGCHSSDKKGVEKLVKEWNESLEAKGDSTRYSLYSITVRKN